MNNKFIKLHNRNNNSVVIVNIENINICATVSEDEKSFKDKVFTIIYIDTHRDDINYYFEVNETVDKIASMILEAKYNNFITLHGVQHNETVCINVDKIMVIDTKITYTDNKKDKKHNNKCMSVLYFKENNIGEVNVNETPEKIYLMIEENYKTVPDSEQ